MSSSEDTVRQPSRSSSNHSTPLSDEKSPADFQSILESTTDGHLIVDLEGHISAFNQRFIELWETSSDKIEAGQFVDFMDATFPHLRFPEGVRSRFLEVLLQVYSDSYDVLEFRNNKILECFSRPRHHDGRVIGRVFSFRDLTFKGRSEEQVRQYANRMKYLADASSTLAKARLDLRATLDVACKVASEYFQDPCMVRLFRGSISELETVAYFHPDKKIQSILEEMFTRFTAVIHAKGTQDVMNAGKSIMFSGSVEQMRSKITPEYLPFYDQYPVHSFIAVPIQIGGTILGVMTVFRFRNGGIYSSDDEEFMVSLVDRAALAIDNAHLYAQSQKAIQLREDFISIASHELKTPLTPLKMQLNLLGRLFHKENFEANPRFKSILSLFDSTNDQILRLMRLIDDMLDVSRMSSGWLSLSKEEVNLAELIRQVGARLRTQIKSEKCELDLQLDLQITGTWDRLRVEQVVNNLISNAIKYGGGEKIIVTTTEKDGFATLTVQDFGIGIASEDQARIFDRFERAVSARKFGGIGMGLFIVRQIVQAHGGRVGLKSEPGVGSTFKVELPMIQSKAMDA